MFRRRSVLAVLLCSVLLSACGWVKDAGVAVFGDEFFEDEDDPRIQALTGFTPRLKIKEVWSASAGAGAEGSYATLVPLVQDDVVFTGDPEGRVRAFSARNGERLWESAFEAEISFGVGGGGDTLMAGTAGGEVIAFAAQDGKQVWRKRVSGDGITAVSRSRRGIALVRDSGGRIIAVAAGNGEKLWELKTALPSLTLRGMSRPLLHGDFGFVGLDDGRVLMLSLDDGRIRREFRIGLVTKGTDLDRIVDVDGRFEIHDGVLYVAAYRGRMLAFDVEKQEALWLTEADSYAGLAVDDRFVYVVGTGGEVRALDRFSGAEAWSNPAFAVRDLSAPLASGKTVVVGDHLGYLYWLSRKTGSILARERVTRSPIAGAPVAWRGHVITLDRGGDLTAAKITARLSARSPARSDK